MKKILFLNAILTSIFAFSQCTITGADQLQVGERQVYTAANSDAVDCTDCYQWTYLEQNVILEGDTQKKELSLKGAVPGDALLSLEIKAKNGKEKCDKLIKVIVPTSTVLSNDNVKCDINVSSFKELRAGDKTVVFEPETAETNLSYMWTVTYRNGDIKKSSEKKGQFDYSDNLVIDKVEMEVFLDRCSTKITKSYNPNFWYFF